MIVALIVYLIIAFLITLPYAGYLTGRHFHRFAKVNPNQPIQINWVSIFYQGLSWPAFWASFVGERLERRATITAGPERAIDTLKRMRDK